MSWPTIQFSIGLDLFPLLAATLAAVGCGLLGNFLVLRRLSLMGDAISHSVLPGLVIAFLITTSRNPLAMFLGAAVAGVGTVVLVEAIKKLGRVEPGAAMGVTFSVLFALGVLLIERASVRHVDLDADCVLHGQLETLVWYDAPRSASQLFTTSTLDAIPSQIVLLFIMVLLAIVFTAGLFKELRIAAFDPSLATSLGFNATVLHYVLMVFVAAATVASFEAVGSILVIAMLICPAATARLLTDRLVPQILLSVVVSLVTGVGGYFAATTVPAMFDKDAVNAAGSMTMVSGLLLAMAIVFAPRHGLAMRLVRRRRLAGRIATDDLLAMLYRGSESGMQSMDRSGLEEMLPGRDLARAIASASKTGLISVDGDSVSLTSAGIPAAADVLRRHRLWERYLVDEAGIAADHVHAPAEQLEHVTPHPSIPADTDPHGKPIPPRE